MLSDQLKEAALREAERHERGEITLPVEIPGNPDIYLGQSHSKIQPFGSIEYKGVTYVIGSLPKK